MIGDAVAPEFVLLIGLLLPALAKARLMARQAKEMAMGHEYMQAYAHYAGENKDGLAKAVAEPEVLGRIRSLSGDTLPDASEAAVAAFLKAQQAQWARIIADRKITSG